MPRSKHRRKPGGKSVRRPGRGKPEQVSPMAAGDRALVRIGEVFSGPFHRQWRDGARGAGFMLDLVSDAIFDLDPPTIGTASQAKIFATYLEPFEDDEASTDDLTPEGAEAALRFLVEQRMVEVDGDTISIHPRFTDMFADPSAVSDANADPVPTVQSG
jgi:hypothetical protein